MPVDSTYLENDRFGYSCYVIVIPAPEELARRLLDIELAADQTHAKIPAHITVKGTFHAIDSLDELILAIGAVAGRHEKFSVSTTGMVKRLSEHSVILDFPVNVAIQSLHDDLIKTVGPLGTTVYPDDPYKVHMSIVNEVEPEGVTLAKSRIDDVDLGSNIPVEALDLMVRDGVWGGTWKRLRRFELG